VLYIEIYFPYELTRGNHRTCVRRSLDGNGTGSAGVVSR